MKRLFQWTILGIALLTTAQVEAQEAEGPRFNIDESFTLYEVASTQARGSGAERATFWQLNTRLRAIVAEGQSVAAQSVLRFEVTKGPTRVAGVRCLTNLLPMGAGAAAPSTAIIVLDCQDGNIRETGEMTVTWFFIDGATDAERQIAQHTIVVRELPAFNRGLPPTPDAPHVIIDRHSEVLSTFIVEDPRVTGLHPAGLFDERYTLGQGMVLTFHTSPQDDEGLHGVTLRCRVDGQPVELTNNRLTHWISNSQYENSWEVVPGATTIATSIQQQYLRFHRYSVLLPITVGNPGPNVTQVRDGAWQCDLRSDTAVTLRTFGFRVAGGRVAPHAEETEGGLTLGPGIHLAETVIPTDHPLDDRTDPSALSRAFYGRGFRSAAARAFQVPAIGVPYPTLPRASGRAPTGRRRR